MKQEVVIVTGSRVWEDEALLCRVLDTFSPKLLVEGGARGADRMARRWAIDNDVEVETHEANWDFHGRLGGVARNFRMLKAHPEALVVAFPLPGGRGTQHCMKLAASFGHRVVVVKPSGKWSIVESFA